MSLAFLTTLEQMGRIFLFLLLGFGLRRLRVLPENAGVGISRLVTTIFLPALLLHSNMTEFNLANVGLYGKLVLLGGGLWLLVTLAALPLSRKFAGGSELEIRKRLIEDGLISQMVTLPSNMFSSVTLPATLWFFDKKKKKKDEILFVDARGVFTQVDRAHRKFSDWQIKNLGIITRLYEGDTAAFKALKAEYKKSGNTEALAWLEERFPDGTYNDVTGLCKVAKLDGEDGIRDQDYSLNAGRYVGVVIEDDGMTETEFKAEMAKLDDELRTLGKEARELEKAILG